MRATTSSILRDLRAVEHERERRLSDSKVGSRVAALKEFQHQRFEQTYSDFLRSERYGQAARFFLDELYGPSDFSRRDSQFARVVPTLVRLFPAEIVDTVGALAELHALSESLDTAMAHQLPPAQVTGIAYVRAWQRIARDGDRRTQIGLTLSIARQLDSLTRRPLLRHSLRMMRGPARTAGLGELQRFLEAGFDSFRAMKGAEEFVGTIETREQALANAMLCADLDADGVTNNSLARALDCLPQP
jgi:hypothetical protein